MCFHSIYVHNLNDLSLKDSSSFFHAAMTTHNVPNLLSKQTLHLEGPGALMEWVIQRQLRET